MAAAGTWLAGTAVDEKPILECAAGSIHVAEVVDRGSLGLDPDLERLLHRMVKPGPV